MANEIIYLTAEGLQKLKDELNHMRSVERPAISAAIAEARDKGDLSENAEYDAAREAQGLLEMRIAKLEQTLTNALQSVLTALNPKATTNDVTTAKDAILEALSHISPEDPYSQALAAFFGITPPVPNAVPMTQQEVEDDLDELWNLIITQ